MFCEYLKVQNTTYRIEIKCPVSIWVAEKGQMLDRTFNFNMSSSFRAKKNIEKKSLGFVKCFPKVSMDLT